MIELRADLFETLRLYAYDGQPLDLGSPTARSLIAYLLLNRSRPLDRRRLAFLFWPRANESAARRNLRQYLHHIRASLEPLDKDGSLLNADGSSIQFNPQTRIILDVETFIAETQPNASIAELEHAISLYTGDLLEDMYDEWHIPERDRLRQLWLGALDRYSMSLQSASRFGDALSVAQKWATAEPFDETAQRRLMQTYALMGDRARAIQTFQSFAQTLEKELHTEPLPETRALLESIQRGELIVEKEPAARSDATRRVKTSKVLETFKVSSTSPLVGREVELDQLDDAYQNARAGAGKLLLITGEAGIGKTRILQEYLARHADISALQSECYELDSMAPFAPLRQALENSSLMETLFKRAPKSAPAWVNPLLPILPGLAKHFPRAAHPAQSDGLALRDAMTHLLMELSKTCKPKPLHLIFDDLHWADTPTWELLASLARRVTSMPLLILGLCRFEDLPTERQPLLRAVQRSAHLQTLDLPRLSQTETAVLARHLNPVDAGDSIFIQRLYQETEGNPFFVIETVHAMQESHVSSRAPIAPSMPHSIQRVIEARLDRLSNESREALAGAAAIGRSFTYPMLQEILQVESKQALGFIEEWELRGLVHEGKQGYVFRHDKFRQVTYAGLSRARREYIHGRIADVLENAIPRADVTTLAYHHARSDQPLKALPYLAQAGEQALRLRAYQEARQFGLQAVNLLGQAPGPRQRSERVDINMQLAQAYAFTGNHPRAIEIIDETIQLASTLGDEKRLGHAFRRAAQFFWLRGQAETANDHARRALRVAEQSSDKDLLFASLRMLGRASIALAAFDDAITYLTRYMNLCDSRASNPPADMPIVLGYLGVAHSRVGAWESAYEFAQRGLQMAEKTSDGEMDAHTLFARMQLAMIYMGHHKWKECLETLAPIPDSMDAEEITPPLYMALSLRGYALANTKEAERGAQVIQSAVEWSEKVGYRVFYYVPRLFLAESLSLANQTQRAQAEAEYTLRETRSSGNRWAVGLALKMLADICARQPHPNWSQIETHLIESMHLLRQARARPDLARTYLSLRRLYDRAGQMAWAVDCHFRATTIFDELGMDDELRLAQGQAAGERKGAVVIPNLPLRGPNVPMEKAKESI